METIGSGAGSKSFTDSDRGLSQSLADLELRLHQNRSGENTAPDFDVLIIGSGYGGAIAAHELSRCRTGDQPLRIGVLERGLEYQRGHFPSRFADLAPHARVTSDKLLKIAQRRNTGLFDIRLGKDMAVLLANGLGGGSLINAGVMTRASDQVFARDWPAALQDTAARNADYLAVETLLGARREGGLNTVADAHQATPIPKHDFVRRLAPAPENFKPAPITVAMQRGPVQPEDVIDFDACNRCGDCATGCNQGAKLSLDNKLLARLRNCDHVSLFTGVTALYFEREPAGKDSCWTLAVTDTDAALRRRRADPAPLRVRARTLILAAGTLGSTELLLRSQHRPGSTLQFSSHLGKHFSGNGGSLTVGFNHTCAVNAVADETVPFARRNVGPTITGLVDLREPPADQEAIVIEEMAVPGPLRRAFEEVYTTLDLLHGLGEADRSTHRPTDADPLAVDAGKILRSSLFAMTGHDGAGGELFLESPDDFAEGTLRVAWPQARELPLYRNALAILKARMEQAGVGGRLIPNPLWQLLPDFLQQMMGREKGPPITVHPLGGCRMGAHVQQGVVNADGQVFDASQPDETALHDGLMILDGSIVPTSLGINPALTIAMLAYRGVRRMIAGRGYREVENPRPPTAKPPLYRQVVVTPPRPTRVQLHERLSGRVQLRDAQGNTVERTLELTLHYQPQALHRLFAPQGPRHLALMEPVGAPLHTAFDCSRLRIFLPGEYEKKSQDDQDLVQFEAALEACAEFSTTLTGSLTLMNRQPTRYGGRMMQSLLAWLSNRGSRDVWQLLARDFPASLSGNPGGGHPLRLLLALASHAGERREFRYDMQTAADTAQAPGRYPWLENTALVARKHIGYRHQANPWRQLSELVFDQPSWLKSAPEKGPCSGGARLVLDTRYLARRQIPLLKIVEHENAPAAWLDILSLLLYFLRMSLSIHFWSFRQPDVALPRRIERFPDALHLRQLRYGWIGRQIVRHERLPRGLRNACYDVKKLAPDIHWIKVPEWANGRRLSIRLTRYQYPNATRPPVLLIHGYSVSGNTFTHPAVEPNLASYLWQRGHDVWVVDLRTSSALWTAKKTWSFEQVACFDLPHAIQYVVQHTGGRPLNLVAHCMGAAMLSLMILKQASAQDSHDPHNQLLARTRKHIHRVVLSQVGPVIQFSSHNRLRAFLLGFALPFIQLSDYEFRVKSTDDMLTGLYDRLLSTVPYSDEEFRLENPAWVPWKRLPWVGTRHRMDALYGRTFELANLHRDVLDHIDDLFGVLDLDTLAQVMHFSNNRVITGPDGNNRLVNARNLKENWRYPTLYLHGEKNGLVDVASVDQMEKLFAGTGLLQTARIEERGHQDCLIGRDAGRVFERIERFLE